MLKAAFGCKFFWDKSNVKLHQNIAFSSQNIQVRLCPVNDSVFELTKLPFVIRTDENYGANFLPISMKLKPKRNISKH